MPTYSFRNNETGEEWTTVITMSEREVVLSNPNVEQLICAPALCDPTRVGVTSKPDSGFRDVLKKIKRDYKDSTINTF